MTIDRDLLDRDVPGLGRPLHFAAHGDPIFAAVLDHVAGFGLASGSGNVPMEQGGDEAPSTEAQQRHRCSTARRIEDANEEASLSHAILVLAVIGGLIELDQSLGRGEEAFGREMRRIEGLIEADDRSDVQVKLDVALVAGIECRLLNLLVPKASSHLLIPAPRWLVLAGVDAALQSAAATKRKVNDLATADMARRLRHQVRDHRRSSAAR